MKNPDLHSFSQVLNVKRECVEKRDELFLLTALHNPPGFKPRFPPIEIVRKMVHFSASLDAQLSFKCASWWQFDDCIGRWWHVWCCPLRCTNHINNIGHHRRIISCLCCSCRNSVRHQQYSLAFRQVLQRDG